MSGRRGETVIIPIKAFEPFRFLFLFTRCLFSHLVSFIVDSHCFPFVGQALGPEFKEDEDLGEVAQKCFLKTLTYRSSTFFRAQGVFRKNLRLDVIVGSKRKHRTGIRCASPFQPTCSTKRLRITASVTPCSGSFKF